MTLSGIFTPTKKKVLILSALILATVILAVWLNFQYVAAIDKKLNGFRNDSRNEVLRVSDEISKLDPSKPAEVESALAKLKELNKSLSERAKFEPGGFRPLLVKTSPYNDSQQKLKAYQKNLSETNKILASIIILAVYLEQMQSAIDPAIKLSASADAVNAQKQAGTWQSSLDKLRVIKPGSNYEENHKDLILQAEGIVKHTKSVLAAQSSKNVDAFTAALTELVKSYDSINKSAEELRADLKLKQKLLSQSSKKIL